MNISIQQLSTQKTTLKTIGSVTNVIKAHVPNELKTKQFFASDYLFGFEAGSPNGLNSIGESILVNGVCYATNTDSSSDTYFETIYGNQFVTNAYIMLDHDQKPAFQVNMTDDKNLSLESIYQSLYHHIQKPIILAGLVDFKILNAIAISKAPVDDLNIFDHKDQYYTQPKVTLQNIQAFVMGAIGNSQDLATNVDLDKILYQNPFDVTEKLLSHMHCLTLKPMVSKIDEITTKNADRTLHVLEESTIVKQLSLMAYVIDEIKIA